MTIALITGGSRGLGRNTALHLARKGVDIVLTYNNNRAAADDVVADLRAIGIKAAALPLDVSKAATFAAFAEVLAETLKTLGHDALDFLLNNAGTGTHASFAETTEEQFDQMVDIHLKSTFFLTQRLLPLLRDGGRVVNTSSGLARFSLPGYAAYGAMKGGIETLTRYMARELGPRGISVNVIAPGAIETDFGGGAVRDNAQLNSFVASVTAMGRVGQPDDIGAAVASLLTAEANWMTGQRLEVSGGMYL
ncbi:SDR family NAD(P)-dependent oxidoreductase [Fuscibacter oryzae]|uniref:SDR family oxidoreductase n=1 Tax=Fuscibacter oryzae TaxID=2803939 RepID=A0A8J7SWN3_9RHOB|nr:SDR family oxidoreductase [Fuscibacter oryzae]MBL4929851.1 SDR family oxidoreductase [Fuscibacter oryzae]